MTKKQIKKLLLYRAALDVVSGEANVEMMIIASLEEEGKRYTDSHKRSLKKAVSELGREFLRRS